MSYLNTSFVIFSLLIALNIVFNAVLSDYGETYLSLEASI